MVGTGGKPCRYADGVGFEVAATDPERGAVAKHKNVRARMRFTAPMTLGSDIFDGGFDGSGQLPFAEFLTKGAYAVGFGGERGIVAPEGDKGTASVFGALDG
jgi:hypothetical protein